MHPTPAPPALVVVAPKLTVEAPSEVRAHTDDGGCNQLCIVGESDGSALKVTADMLDLHHLDPEVTVPQVVILRDDIIDSFILNMGARFISNAIFDLLSLLNYIGGIWREYVGHTTKLSM